MSKRLTRWFNDHAPKPFHVGEYDTCWIRSGIQRRRYWDGEQWRHSEKGEVCSLQCFYWRGLAKKP